MIRSFERSLSVRKPSRVEHADVAGVQPAVGERRRASPPDCSSSRASPSARAPALRRSSPTGSARSSASAMRTSMPICATPTDAEARIVAARDRVGDQRAVHRGDRHRRLALAVDLREARAERRERLLAVGDVHRPAAVDDALQAIERALRRSRGAATRRFTIVGAAKKQARSHAPSSATISAGVEAARLGHDVDRAARDVRQQIETRAVRQRRGMQERVARRDRLRRRARKHCAHRDADCRA